MRILTDEQVEALRGELEHLMDPGHAGRELFHEYHSNESTDPDRVVFHALGAWRVMPGFHDLLWNPAFLVPASQLLGGAGALLARPAFLQACAAWRSGGMAPGLFVLDAHDAAGSSDVLDRLDDSTRENGCLNYVPGSHKWPDLPKPVLTGEMDGIRAVCRRS